MKSSVFFAIALTFAACCVAQAEPGAGRAIGSVAPAFALEQNTGAYPDAVRFLARSPRATVYLTPAEMVMLLDQHKPGRRSADGFEFGEPRQSWQRVRSRWARRSSVLRISFIGGDPEAPSTGLDRRPGSVNYLRGADSGGWHTGVPLYGQAHFQNVYPGIGVQYYGSEAASRHRRPLEFDFVVQAGADPGQIRLGFTGARRVRVDGGSLVMTTSVGDVRLKPPLAYQEIDGRRVPVGCRYTLNREAPAGAVTAGLSVDRYDAARTLVIDPILDFATFLGGANADGATGIAVDATGASYVTGYSYGSDFPTTNNAYDQSANGDLDAFVAKVASDGKSLVYATYVGGSNWDYCHGIAVDASGSAYIAGETVSDDFPVTAGAFQTALNGTNGDAFTVKLTPDGSGLAFSTYFGGTEWEAAYGIAVDGAGVVIAGYTQSLDMPTSVGAYDTTYNGGDSDVFAVRFAPNGGSLVGATYIGGSAGDYGNAVALDTDGSILVAGQAYSANLPTTAGAVQTAFQGGDYDAFALRLNSGCTSLVYCTYLGGSSTESAAGIAAASNGDAIVIGNTASANFPTTGGGFDTTINGDGDGFACRVSANGNSLAYGTFIGGSATDGCLGVAVDGQNRASVIGYTYSTNFPLSPNAFDTALPTNDVDAFVLLLSADGSTALFSSYIGGGGSDVGYGVALDPSGAAYLTGDTWSADFPVTAGAYDTVHGGEADVFVARVVFPLLTNTSLYTIDRTGTITENIALRSYSLKRLSDNAYLSGKTITFRIDGTPVGTATTDVSGNAMLLWTITDGPSARTITAEFAGDSSYNASSDNAALTAVSWSTKIIGFDRTRRITGRTELKCRLLRSDNAPLYNKNVSFTVDGTYVITRPTDVNGYAKYPYYDVPDGAGAGTRSILSQWAGNGGYGASSNTAVLTVQKALPYIWVLSKSVPSGGVANLYAYFRRLYDLQKQKAKTVTFKVDGTPVQTVVTNDDGVARYLYPTVESVGSHTIRCEFGGDAWVEAGYGSGSLTIL
ncbi:MAG: SBBP repeat-containing protein [Chthonomonadales bacterium]|nr:SBBP repeat-containing protein [Chthonomonadales bacterium]